ncbi:hypothetical protein KM1_083070 [Entamoeba histolytica HM-3:IMSS]|uniref:Uncharacterized protein n=1 Tax=Entamoeba histolytica HM-3:IMSS TaxID=885315 RepID=M7WZG3_ENTHI|nr:hypothetical protein KM1_083070 [Entamoeba histolytica HM-3:IMSS]
MSIEHREIDTLNNNINDEANNGLENEKPTKHSFIIKANSITGKPTKDLEFNNVDMSQSRISDVKKAIQRVHSLHPKVSYIEIRKDDDPNQIPINDNTYLYTLGDFEYLYATFTTPLSINEKLNNYYNNYLKDKLKFINKYFINYTVFGLTLLWFIVATSNFRKVLFGILFLLHYLCLKKIITIHFTFDRQHSSRMKPLLTFFLSLYPYWNPYDPQHNTIIDETETNKTEQQNHQEIDPNVHIINDNNENEINDMNNTFIPENENNENINQEQDEIDDQLVAQN